MWEWLRSIYIKTKCTVTNENVEKKKGLNLSRCNWRFESFFFFPPLPGEFRLLWLGELQKKKKNSLIIFSPWFGVLLIQINCGPPKEWKDFGWFWKGVDLTVKLGEILWSGGLKFHGVEKQPGVCMSDGIFGEYQGFTRPVNTERCVQLLHYENGHTLPHLQPKKC